MLILRKDYAASRFYLLPTPRTGLWGNEQSTHNRTISFETLEKNVSPEITIVVTLLSQITNHDLPKIENDLPGKFPRH
jgi:hypothetical protein